MRRGCHCCVLPTVIPLGITVGNAQRGSCRLLIALLQTVLFGQGHPFVVGDADILKEIPAGLKDSCVRVCPNFPSSAS